MDVALAIGEGVAVKKKKWNPEYSPLSHLTLDSGMAGFDEAAFLRSTGRRDLPDAVKPAPLGAITGKGHQLLTPTRELPEIEVTVENIDYVNGRRIR